MKTKKHPKANLENYSKLFVQLGLVLSLLIVFMLIQSKTLVNEISVLSAAELNSKDNTPETIEYQIEQPKEVEPPKKVTLDIVKQIDDDIDLPETIFKNIDPTTPVDISKIKEVDKEVVFDPKDEVFDLNFMEEAPLFPGCKGTSDERKACFSEMIQKHINKKFNSELGQELGLQPGVQRIYTLFKIDKNGNVIDIEARASHVRLKDEAMRVIESLPKMQPGKQHGVPVKVRYSIPITFKIE